MKDKILIDLQDLHINILEKYNISIEDFLNIVDYIRSKEVIKLDK